MAIKLIALDLDGTTLSSKKNISSRNRAGMESAAAKGVNIVVATGRPFAALPKDVFEIEAIRYILTSNGASITDVKEKRTFYENCISSASVEKAVELLKRYDYILEGFVKGEAYIQGDYYEYVKRTGKSFRDVNYILETRKPVEDIYEFLLENKEHIENINVNFEDMSDKPKMYSELIKLPDVTITSSLKNNLEIGGATTSKAEALRKMGELLGIKQEEMMAIGDSPNDIEMLKAAGMSVAVGNAEEEVKEQASYISADNDNDGVAEAIEKFVLKK